MPLAFWTIDNKLMILRNKPAVLDTSKFQENKIHNRQYASLLMYCHWNKEDEFLREAAESADVCNDIYEQHKNSIEEVMDGLKKLVYKTYLGS